MNTINYSFIIPHKNIPDLLQRCLDSIPRRDDVQVIVVDDNSDPDKVDFEHFPGVGEPCVEVYFTKEGKGAGYARNVGLKHAKGKWILFADSDDFYVDEVLNVLDDCVNRKEDVIYFLSQSIYSDTKEVANRHIRFNQLIEDYDPQNFLSVGKLRYEFMVPWSKLVRRDLILQREIQFDEVKYSNDVMFSLKVGYWASEISVVKEYLYNVTVVRGSLTNRSSRENLLCRYEVTLNVNKFLRSVGASRFQYSIMRFVIFSFRYGLSTFVKVVSMGIQSDANFFVGYRNWCGSLFKILRRSLRNRKYIVTE